MGFSFEPKILILRAGKTFTNHGDPFDFVATITIDKGIAHVQGAIGRLPRVEIPEFFKSLKKLGVQKVIWERLKTKSAKNIEIDL